jgi:predicted CoA-binding protein
VVDVTDLATLLHEPDATVAVVGATDNPAKYGSVIYRDLKAKGFRVFPVNLHRSTVDGDPAYPDLASLPERPTVIDVVVPPDQTMKVLEQVVDLGLDHVWVQPGAEDDEVERFVAEHGLDALVNTCIMVRTRTRV